MGSGLLSLPTSSFVSLLVDIVRVVQRIWAVPLWPLLTLLRYYRVVVELKN